MCIRDSTYTHTYTHTHSHTDTYTDTHTYTHTHIHTHTHTHTHTLTHTLSKITDIQDKQQECARTQRIMAKLTPIYTISHLLKIFT